MFRTVLVAHDNDTILSVFADDKAWNHGREVYNAAHAIEARAALYRRKKPRDPEASAKLALHLLATPPPVDDEAAAPLRLYLKFNQKGEPAVWVWLPSAPNRQGWWTVEDAEAYARDVFQATAHANAQSRHWQRLTELNIDEAKAFESVAEDIGEFTEFHRLRGSS